jgi:hypothetical protein
MSNITVLHRVPDPTNPADKNRLVRFTEIVAGIFNSLFRRGKLVMKDGQAEWSITVDALSGRGPPPAALGEVGMVYFDVSDPMNLQFYWKT